MTLVERARELRPLLVEAAQSLSDNDALQAKEFYNDWSSYIGKEVKEGLKFTYEGSLWRARSSHTPQSHQPPSIYTASLYETINESNAGTYEDPIPYDQTMAVEKGLYYIENNIIYKCIRDSGNPLYSTAASLVGNYFEVA